MQHPQPLSSRDDPPRTRSAAGPPAAVRPGLRPEVMVQLLLVPKGLSFCRVSIVGDIPTYTFQLVTFCGGLSLSPAAAGRRKCANCGECRSARLLAPPHSPKSQPHRTFRRQPIPATLDSIGCGSLRNWISHQSDSDLKVSLRACFRQSLVFGPLTLIPVIQLVVVRVSIHQRQSSMNVPLLQRIRHHHIRHVRPRPPRNRHRNSRAGAPAEKETASLRSPNLVVPA